jgi:mono/diheme cytochrome c family protein
MARWFEQSEMGNGPSTSPGSRRAGLAGALTALLILGSAFVLLSPGAEAKQKFMSGFAQAYPAAAGTALDSCLLCHTNPVNPGENNLNNYGEDWEDGDFGDKNFLEPALVNRDSDGDGIPNGQEIQQLSLPGDPSSSTPPTTTTTLPGTPPNGQALYAARCAVCHGPDGGDLSATARGRSTFISITLNGQGGMPPQSGLSTEEAGAIWDYVTGAVPTSTTTTRPGATTTTTTPAGGSTVWAQQCAACHGANGGNVVPTTRTKAQLVSIVTNGVPGMRGFPELGTAQISNVADYLLSLSVPPTTQPGATTTTTSPRSGTAVYAASCALCHGADGGNLRGHTLELSRIVSITSNGVGTMSGYSGRLSAAEISNVAQYVASIGASAGVTTTTAPPGSPISGSTLYQQNCSACHGLHGEGGPGGAVAGTTLGRSQTIAVITGGASGMPGYASQLSSAEIGAVADHVLGMAGGDSTSGTTVGETAPDGGAVPPELEEGHSLFGRFCAACHGANGEGGLGGPVAGINISAAELDEIIRSGVGSMPGFADRMTNVEIDALVAYSEALASGREFAVADSTTTTGPPSSAGEDGGFAPQALGTSEPGQTAGNSPWPVVVISLVAGLMAAGAAVIWARLGRDLIK